MSHTRLRGSGCVVLAVLLGCGGCTRSDSTGPGKPGDASQPPADVSAQEKELAELERQVEAKEKELAELRTKADALRTKLAAAKKPGGATPLIDLLGTLPKDRWPTDYSDSLRMAQAEEWFAKNLVGKKARWEQLAPTVTFEGEGNDRFKATIDGVSAKASPFGYELRVSVKSTYHADPDKFLVVVGGLRAASAEQLRSRPKDRAVAVEFSVKQLKFHPRDYLLVEVEDPSIVGLTP